MLTHAPRAAVVIPARNEASYIAATLESLTAGLDPATAEIVVVNNASTDGTAEVVSKVAATTPVTIHQIDGPDPSSAIAARVAGVHHALSSPSPPEVLVSGDADVIYQHNWLPSILERIESGADVVAAAGFFDPRLWTDCPSLFAAYLAEIGSIFFDPATIAQNDVDESRCLFTRRIHEDFGIPLCSCGFAITSDAYSRLGGFRREYYDSARQKAIRIAAQPLAFRADYAGLAVASMFGPLWLHSPRRLLAEPIVHTGQSRVTQMPEIRSESGAAYANMDTQVNEVDFEGLRLNCVRDYILTPCITRPERLRSNEWYFGSTIDPARQEIESFNTKPSPAPREVYDLAAGMTQKYGHLIIDNIYRATLDR